MVRGIRDRGGAGALKWMLNDFPNGANPRENSFGMFRADGSPKPRSWPRSKGWARCARSPAWRRRAATLRQRSSASPVAGGARPALDILPEPPGRFRTRATGAFSAYAFIWCIPSRPHRDGTVH